MSCETCVKCDCETGRAGAADDSIYIEIDGETVGPLCEECYRLAMTETGRAA